MVDSSKIGTMEEQSYIIISFVFMNFGNCNFHGIIVRSYFEDGKALGGGTLVDIHEGACHLD